MQEGMELKEVTQQQLAMEAAFGIASKQATPKVEDKPGVTPEKITVLVDANAFIKKIPLPQIINPTLSLEEFNERYELLTLSEVIAEIKDEKTREFLQSTPYDLKVVQSSTLLDERDFAQVEDFARETGDKASLSRVDILVIAAGLSLSRQNGELDKVRLKPAALSEFQPRQYKKEFEDKAEMEARASGDVIEEEADDFDEFQTVDKVGARKPQAEAVLSAKQKKQMEQAMRLMALESSDDEAKPAEDDKATEDVKEEEAVPAVDSEDSWDDEEDGGQWVTSDNLYKHLNGDGSKATNLMLAADAKLFEPKGEEKVEVTTTEPKKEIVEEQLLDDKVNYIKFVTADYAMQNVILQMGFQLMNLDGMLVDRVKRYKLLCKACKHINMEIERMFCKRCGAAMLAKVSVYMNDKGEITYFNNPRRRINLRGTVYSIPDPKGGRGCKDMILREDDLLRGEYKQLAHKIDRKKRQELNAINDTLDGNYWAGGAGYGSGAVSNLLFEDGAKGGKTGSKVAGIDKIQYGYGKKNPNISRKKY